MHPDHAEYINFTSRARLEKSVNSLLGLIEGIAIDSAINKSEVEFLNLWLLEHCDVQKLHPYNELVPVVRAAVSDGSRRTNTMMSYGYVSVLGQASTLIRRRPIFRGFMQSWAASSPTGLSPSPNFKVFRCGFRAMST
jgi:hypothetical protein